MDDDGCTSRVHPFSAHGRTLVLNSACLLPTFRVFFVPLFMSFTDPRPTQLGAFVWIEVWVEIIICRRGRLPRPDGRGRGGVQTITSFSVNDG